MDKNVITAATNVNSRDITFDIMKGIGIIAMIIGHCSIPHVLFKFIFMWHMPLFFIISGYFYKKKNNRDMFISLFTSLIIPYIFTSLIIVIVSTCISLFKGNFNSPFFLGMLFGSGSTNNPLLFGGHCFIGALWFLLALFWSKMIYNTISNRFTNSYHLGGVIIVSSIFASYIGRIVFIPTNVLQGVAALIFFYIGSMVRINDIKNIDNHLIFMSVLCLFILPLGFLIRTTGMVDCSYSPNYPLMVLVALSGTCLVYVISTVLKKYTMGAILARFGRISILVLSIHIIDLDLAIFSHLSNFLCFSDTYEIPMRLLIALGGSLIISQFKYIRIIFKLRTI